MSRHNLRHPTELLLEAAEHWKERCLLQDGSLLSQASDWRIDHLLELEQRVIQNPQQGNESYLQKLSLQLAGASAASVRLMAELNWVLLLFSSNIKPVTKRELIRNIWELTGEPLPASKQLEDQTLAGAGSTGTGFNTHRWRELAFLIELLKAFKALPLQRRRSLLDTPWAFADWVDEFPEAAVRQFRHIICFLLFPDHFEATSVGRDKKTILEALDKIPKVDVRSMNHTKVDQALLNLHTRLEQQTGGPVDFHQSPWVERWRPSPRTWLLAWNPNDREWTSFQDDRLRVAHDNTVTLRWRIDSMDPKQGETAYVVLLGAPPIGVIACGTIISNPGKDTHDTSNKAGANPNALYVDLTLTNLRDPEADPYVSLADLQANTAGSQNWTPQSSVIEIEPRSARLMEKLWAQLPPVRLDQTSQPTPRQQAIHIGKPVNQIFYGPPGTGKTHHWRSHLQAKYESTAGSVTRDEWHEAQLANTTWWETVALALADQIQRGAGTQVSDLLVHPFFLAKARVQGQAGSPNLRATCWSQLQIHTVHESATVNYAPGRRQTPLIFDKQPDGHWILTGDWADTGDGLREQLEQLQRGPQDKNARIKRYLTVTFHQSFSYEDFVEGIRPQTTDGGIRYEVCDGILKRFCKQARQNPKQRYALFIDEINRGNISRIFGELITLIEVDKRGWWDAEGQLVDGMEVTLPYSGERFGVPKNLDIYATMNSADRSITLMDAALRRRFHFVEIIPEPTRISGNQGDGRIPDGEDGWIDLRQLLGAINQRLRYLLHRDQTFGHAYFMGIKDIDALRHVMLHDIIPMLAEYFYDDWEQIRRVLADDQVPPEDQIITHSLLDPRQLFPEAQESLPEKPDYQVRSAAEMTPDALRKIYESLAAQA